MDRKTIAAIVLSVGVVWFWTKYVMIPPDPNAAVGTDTGDGGVKKADVEKKSDDKSPVAAVGETKPATEAGKPGEAPPVQQPETFTTVEVAGRLKATLSSRGGVLHDLVLLDPQFVDRSRSPDHPTPIDLVALKETPLPFSVTFPDSGFVLPADADMTLADGATPNEKIYSWERNGVRVEKRWRFVPGTYEGAVDVTVENKTDKALPASIRLTLAGRQDPEVQTSLFKPYVVQTEGLCSAKKVKRENLQSLLKESTDNDGLVRVVAIDRKFFVLAAAMVPVDGTKCHIEGQKSGRVTVAATQPVVSIAPGGKQSWSFTTFMGPKVVKELDSAQVGGQDAHLGDVMNYGFTELFARPMLWVLKAAHRAIGNYGVAIILLTLLLKLITWWPTAQSMKSAQSMAKLKPEIDKLKEKYGDDKQRINTEMMQLYSKHKINPIGGCLPVLLQMPIYIAFYSMLGNSVELYGAHFLWLKDLTAPEGIPPILPICTGILMFVQQKLSPTAVDPQQKQMMTIMPIMFTGMSLFLPAGLTLYILTNTALSILQQRITAPTPTTTNDAPASKKKKA